MIERDIRSAMPFRFDAATHQYIALDTGEILPHITSLLQQSGWVDERWFTEESCARGTAVHKLTADVDYGVLTDCDTIDTRYRSYILSHIKAMRMIPHQFLAIEEPAVHPTLRFGGTPDRELIAWGLRSVLELKTGSYAKSHPVQLALQAILLSAEARLPPETFGRFCLYLKPNGRSPVFQEFTDRRDFDEAYRIIKEYA